MGDGEFPRMDPESFLFGKHLQLHLFAHTTLLWVLWSTYLETVLKNDYLTLTSYSSATWLCALGAGFDRRGLHSSVYWHGMSLLIAHPRHTNRCLYSCRLLPFFLPVPATNRGDGRLKPSFQGTRNGELNSNHRFCNVITHRPIGCWAQFWFFFSPESEAFFIVHLH